MSDDTTDRRPTATITIIDNDDDGTIDAKLEFDPMFDNRDGAANPAAYLVACKVFMEMVGDITGVTGE